MSNKQQTILITGATSGIGRHAALYLVARGHRVFAGGRNEASMESLRGAAAAVAADGGALETVRLDVTSAASIAAAKQHLDARTGGRGIDVLVNNAGFGVLGPTELISDDDMRAQYETNVFGLMAVTRAFLPEMRARRRGRVINVSSIGGLYTLPLFGVYNSTKYAVESLSDALRMELQPFGVHVSLVEPGAIHSNFTDRSMDGGAKYRNADSPYAPVLDRADALRKMAERTMVGPETVSRAILRAATARTPRARYIAPRLAAFVVALARLLPARWTDAVSRAAFGFTRRRFAAALPAPATVETA